MTEKEIKGLGFIYKNVLPKLHEIQRSLALNRHFTTEVDAGCYKFGVSMTIYVKSDVLDPSQEILKVETFSFPTYRYNGEKSYDKTLRGIDYFISNWMVKLA